MATADAQAGLMTLARQLETSKYVGAVGLAALLYDHLLTLADEVHLIWRASWSTPKVLFLINRYMIPCLLLIHAYDQSGLSGSVISDEFCKVYMTLSLYLGMVSIAISNFLVLLRLWILWDNNQRLIAWTIFLYVLTQIASVITTTLIVVQIVPLLHHDLDTNICFMNQKVDIASLWIPGIIFELMVFLTTWWNALSRPRSLETPLSRALYRDGILYFGTLFALRITNLVMALSAPLSLIFLGVFFIWSISNITLARLVLNCRKLTVAAIKEAKAKAARPIGEGERSSTALSFMDGDVELSAMCEDVYIDAENVRRSRVTMPRPPGLYDV